MAFSVKLSSITPGNGWSSGSLLSFDASGAVIHSLADRNLERIQQAARKLAGLKPKSLALTGDNWCLASQWAFFLGYNSPKDDIKIVWATLNSEDAKAFENRRRSFLWAKQVINETPENMSPQALADAAQKFIAEAADIEVETYVGEHLKDAGYTGVYEVGRGSERPPVLQKIVFTPPGCEDAPADIALVGKGITYDSGGYSIKASESMFSMKCDMAGAATLTAALHLAIKQGLNKKVMLILCCAENLISGHAYKLGDILTYKNGTRVEIANTDAEGRLVLADGLIMAAEAGAKVIIDAATLTGAAMVAVGTEYNAIFCQDTALREQVLACAQDCNERTWPLPLAEFHQDNCPSQFADTANSRAVKGGGFGGASNAAGFLARFVPAQTPWVHFDLAAAYNEGPNARYGAGATGQGIMTIAKLLTAS